MAHREGSGRPHRTDRQPGAVSATFARPRAATVATARLVRQSARDSLFANVAWHHHRGRQHLHLEAITKSDGLTGYTYGYTAYGSADTTLTTDEPVNGYYTGEPSNTYMYNGQKLDWASGTYDMGSRDYHPGINRFLTPDSFQGAAADRALSTGPGTTNRYGFAGGNPVNFLDPSGHNPVSDVIGDFFGAIGDFVKDTFKGAFQRSFLAMCAIDGDEGCFRDLMGGLQPLVEDPVGTMWHDVADPVEKSYKEGHPGAAAAFILIGLA